jgi:hypothetical protein
MRQQRNHVRSCHTTRWYKERMFGLGRAKLPIAEEDRLWIDRSLARLAGLLGIQRMRQAVVMLPTPEHFPDRFDGTDKALDVMFRRVAERMEVDPDTIELEIFDDATQASQTLVPFWSGENSGAGGLYGHDGVSRTVIAVNSSQLKNPMALVATLAHELGHAILLRPGLVKPNEPDMEPLNDLLTVFLGFGVFNANSVFQFQQYNSYDRQGWSTRRLGYLSEQQFGYALARFAVERGESKPEWAKYLSTNVASYYKESIAWLRENERRG